MKNKDLIIIPGAMNPKLAKYPIIRHVTRRFRRHFKLTQKPTDRTMFKLIKKLSPLYENIYFVNYNRELLSIFKKKNYKMINNAINNTKNDYDLLCFSFGGYLIQRMLQKNQIKKLPKKIVLAFSVNPDKNIKFPKNVEVINIYSTIDKFVKRGIKVIVGKKGNIRLRYAKNVSLDSINHSQIHMNIKIKKGPYVGYTGPALIERLLTKDF
jgi:hypothetical protein